MTTIVIKGGVVVADSLATSSGELRTGQAQKLFRGRNGEVLALCGSMLCAHSLMRWHQSKKRGEQPYAENCALIEVSKSGTVIYEHGQFGPASISEYDAFGSGCEVARGALEMGATAEQAVEIAIRLDTKSGGPVVVMAI